MVEFLTAAEAEATTLKADVKSTMTGLEELYGYFGEKYDGNDPVRILSTIASFLDIFDKSIASLKVSVDPTGDACKRPFSHPARLCCGEVTPCSAATVQRLY